jgi:putative restriction endonuclease
MEFPLSIRTVFARPGRRIWYDDQLEAHRQIFGSTEAVAYDFMGANPDHRDNRGLADACAFRVPLIYFLGVAPGVYQPIFPTFVASVDRDAHKVQITFGTEGEANVEPPETSQERRYALRTVKQRLHQAQFREAVLSAYDGRCAFSGLPAPVLLDAAHIIPDRHGELGQALVINGLPLSKVHHAAFDSHLIGVDADRRVHVSRRLLDLNDGPVLESLKSLEGAILRAPRRARDAPDPDRLAERFRLFRQAA